MKSFVIFPFLGLLVGSIGCSPKIYSAAVANGGVGALVLTLPNNLLYPIGSSNPPGVQDNTVSLSYSATGTGTISLSCVYETVGLSSSDPNYAAPGGSTRCSALPTLTTAGDGTDYLSTNPWSSNSASGSATASISWIPSSTQRGTYRFIIAASDTHGGTKSGSTYVTVMENYTTSNLLSLLDTAAADVGSGAPLTSVPVQPRLTSNSDNNTSGLFQTLIGSFVGSLSGFTTSAPYQGTGQASTSTVSPYTLAFDGSNDSMGLGSVFGSSSQIALETWIKPGTPSTSGAVIASNALGTATTNGFQLRQSTTPANRAEFVVGEKYYSYRDLILSDQPVLYYRLDEPSSSTTAVDSSSNSNSGQYENGNTSASGAITGDSDTSTALNGSNEWVNSTSAVSGSQTFSEEIWFKTASGYSSGGEIMGFGNWTGFSSSNDRQVWMDNSGYLNFGIYNSGTYVVSSASTYNDGNWHYVVGTFTANSQILYVDGISVASSTASAGAQVYTGYWHLGYMNLGSWSPTPSSDYFQGSLDEAAIYGYVLTPTQISNHFETGAVGHAVVYPGNAILADHPTGYWRLGEKSGTIASDSSGYGNDLTYSGGITLGQSGPLTGDSSGSALFDGSTGHLNLGNLLSSGAYTKEAWVNCSNSSSYPNILSSISDNYTAFYINNNELTGFQNNGVYVNENAIFPLNSWQYVVLTFDPNVSSGTMNLYRNGNLVAQATSVPTQSGTDLQIGSYDTTYFFPGSIAEVAIYNYALSPTQVANHYNSGNGAGWWFCQSQTQLNSSNWNFLSAIYNGTTSQLFANGQQECSVTPGTTYSDSNSTYVGAMSGSSSFWQGVLSYLGLFGSSSTPLTSTNTNTDFSATANRFRKVPVEDIVTSGLVLNIDPANANHGLAPYSNGCTSSLLSWFDLSSAAHNGTLAGFSGTCITDGWLGNGTVASPYQIAFNGSTDFVSVGSIPYNAQTVTAAAWVNTTSSNDQKVISLSSSDAILGVFSGLARNCLGAGGPCFTGAAVGDGNWHYIVSVGTDTTQYLYVDGNPAVTSSGTFFGFLSGNSTVGQESSGYYYTGSMGPVMVWNTSLSAQQVKQNCLAQEHRFTSTPQSICGSP